MKPTPAAHAPAHARRHPAPRRGAFTLIELLVTIAIIVVLIGILVPVVGKVRTSAQVASVQSQLTQIAGAIDRYQQDFRAPPGPIPNTAHGLGVTTALMPDGSVQLTSISGNENMVLGLFGGLANAAGVIGFYPDQVGRGPQSLNVANPRRYEPYLEPTNLSTAGVEYEDEAWPLSSGRAGYDSVIPELLDTFGDPMPILYLRARRGATGTNIIAPTGAINADFQYHIDHILGYTTTDGTSSIGIGREADTHGIRTVDPSASLIKSDASYFGPPDEDGYDAWPYFRNPQTGEARQKDSYILISAGADRTYGTDDDITNFGSVVP